MITLDSFIRMVTIQFSFSNPDVTPAAVKHLERETALEYIGRKLHATGSLAIEPTENCSLAELLGGLEAAGYEMVDAFYKERIDAKDPRGKRTYHMVRFLFARREFVDLSVEFKKVRDTIRAELQEMCRTALWRVRLFSNPFYKNGEEIVGQCALSINLEARKPLFRPDGQPVTIWQRDEKGKRVGNAPLPLQADHCLRLVDNMIRLEAREGPSS